MGSYRQEPFTLTIHMPQHLSPSTLPLAELRASNRLPSKQHGDTHGIAVDHPGLMRVKERVSKLPDPLHGCPLYIQRLRCVFEGRGLRLQQHEFEYVWRPSLFSRSTHSKLTLPEGVREKRNHQCPQPKHIRRVGGVKPKGLRDGNAAAWHCQQKKRACFAERQLRGKAG